MARVQDVQAQPLPGGDRIDVLRFEHDHERMRLGPHRHRDLELMYIERGSGTHRLGTRTYEVSAGDVVLLTPGLVHDATSLTGAAGWAVEFDPLALGLRPSTEQIAAPSLTLSRTWWSNPLLAPFLRAEQQPASARFTIAEPDRRVWAAHLRIMHRERTERRDGYREMVGAYLRIILVALSRVAADHTVALHHTGESTLADVFTVIEERYRRPLSTSDVAAVMGLTPGYLTTLVRRQTGRTVGEWITERRMAAARELLTSTDLSAEQVSARVGYTDPAYFSRKFRQVHGTSLRAWRTATRTKRSYEG
jgi:AraC-like DNA-binding protein